MPLPRFQIHLLLRETLTFDLQAPKVDGFTWDPWHRRFAALFSHYTSHIKQEFALDAETETFNLNVNHRCSMGIQLTSVSLLFLIFVAVKAPCDEQRNSTSQSP